jgi:hypothetical protein
VDRSARMETKDVAPVTATPAAGPVPAPASQPPPLATIAPPPPQQHQQTPSPFAQQQAAPAPGGMRLSFEQMAGKPPGEQQHHHHAVPMLYAPPPPQGGNVLGMGDMMRKKRGRPRKYAPDGSMALALAPISSASAGGSAPPGQQQQQYGFSISSPPSDPNAKRRGRPPGSGKKKQFEALGTSRWSPAASCPYARPPFRSKSHLLLCPWWLLPCRFLGHRLHSSHPHRQGRGGKINRSRLKTFCCIDGVRNSVDLRVRAHPCVSGWASRQATSAVTCV